VEKNVNRIKRAAEALGFPTLRRIRPFSIKLTAFVIAFASLLFNVGLVNAATLTTTSIALANSQPSATTSYNFTASGVTGSAIECVQEVYSVSADGTGGVPTGMTTTGASLDATSTYITTAHWAVATSPVNGTVAFQYSTGTTPSASGTIQADGIVNSSVATTTSGYWMNFSSWTGPASAGVCTGTKVDSAEDGFTVTTGNTLSLTVSPTLTFQVSAITTSGTCSDGSTHPTVASTATTIPFGTIAPGTNGIVCQNLNAATNSTHGFTIYAAFNNAPTNATAQTITSVAALYTAPATFATNGAQGGYGYSTSDTSGSNLFATGTKYAAMTTTNEPVAFSSVGVTSANYVVTHQVGVTTTTFPGTYSDTIFYTCTPVY
jgi:hypothetical protein